MTPEEAMQVAYEVFLAHTSNPLTDIQRMILRESLAGKGYESMEGYAPQHIKNEGKKLWDLLSEALGEKVSKTNFKGALEKRLKSGAVVLKPLKDDEQPWTERKTLARWNSYVNFHSEERLVSFELENSPVSLGVAEPDDTGRKEIRLGQGFRLIYQLPFAGYGLLMQGFKASWVVTRLGKCKDLTIDKKTRYIQERITAVPVGRWSVPANRSYLREKTDVGLHRFALLLTQQPIPEKIQEMITQEPTECSSLTLSTLVEYIESDTSSMRLIVAECDIISL